MSRSIATAVIAVAFLATGAPAQERDFRAVARNLVQAAMLKPGDKVLISGSTRDARLLEDVAIEAMKVGAQPLISLSSDRLIRLSYDEVPATYDTQSPALGLALVNTFDAQIEVDVGESESLLAHVPLARRTARAKASEPVTQAFLRRNVRYVNLGNAMYPTVALSRRVGVPRPQLEGMFWRAAAVSPQTLRARGEALRAAFAGARGVTLTHPNGTNLTFRVAANRIIVSDGVLTAEELRQGHGAASTWLPAGEFIAPAVPGTANGTVVIDRVIWDGREIRNLTLTYRSGRLTSMTAASGIEGLRARYNAAGGAKDQFGFIDIGLNPEVRLPAGTGRIIWTAPGAVTIGLGDNRGFGGDNASDFFLPTQLQGATVRVNGRVVVESGVLR